MLSEEIHKKGKTLTLKLTEFPRTCITDVYLQWFFIHLLFLVRIARTFIFAMQLGYSHSWITWQFARNIFLLSSMTILQNSELSFMEKSHLSFILFIHSNWQWLIIIPRGENLIQTIYFMFTQESIVCYCKTLKSWWILTGFLLSPGLVTAPKKKKKKKSLMSLWVWNYSEKKPKLNKSVLFICFIEMPSKCPTNGFSADSRSWTQGVHTHIFPFV